MPLEIERKYLVLSDGWRSGSRRQESYRQGYIARSADRTVRVRASRDRCWLTIKSGISDLVRAEYEYEIPAADADAMLRTICLKPLIEKTRHFVPAGRHVWQVDVFSGDLDGLVVAEVELSRADEGVEHPAWLGPEITSDARYLNGRLATLSTSDARALVAESQRRTADLLAG